MNYRYLWKELSQDGLLREPNEVGEYYNNEPVNGYSNGFKTEQAAIDYLISINIRHDWSCPRALTLIKVFSPYEQD